MVEPLNELRVKCQKPQYKEVGNWMVRTFLRDAALPCTRLLLHTNITANQVTFVSLIIGILGFFCFAIEGPVYFVLGSFLLQFWYYLDHVDGQLARYYGKASLTGRFFDFITHHIIHAPIYFFLGIYCYYLSGSFLFVLWGFVTSFSLMIFNLVNDTKYKTFFERLEKNNQITLKHLSNPSSQSSGVKSRPILKKGFSFIHKANEIHVLMNVLTLSSLLQLLIPTLDFRFFLFFFYGITAPLLAVAKITYIISRQKIDEDYAALIEEA